MSEPIGKRSSDTESHRFGSIAVFRRYVTLQQIQQALAEQLEDNVHRRPHRRLGTILREKNWITEDQEQSILAELLRNLG